MSIFQEWAAERQAAADAEIERLEFCREVIEEHFEIIDAEPNSKIWALHHAKTPMAKCTELALTGIDPEELADVLTKQRFAVYAQVGGDESSNQ